MSLVHRVMSDAWENLLTSAGEKDMTCRKVSRLRSRAMVAAVRDATAPTTAAQARPTRQSANIVAPVEPR